MAGERFSFLFSFFPEDTVPQGTIHTTEYVLDMGVVGAWSQKASESIVENDPLLDLASKWS